MIKFTGKTLPDGRACSGTRQWCYVDDLKYPQNTNILFFSAARLIRLSTLKNTRGKYIR